MTSRYEAIKQLIHEAQQEAGEWLELSEQLKQLREDMTFSTGDDAEDMAARYAALHDGVRTHLEKSRWSIKGRVIAAILRQTLPAAESADLLDSLDAVIDAIDAALQDMNQAAAAAGFPMMEINHGSL